MATGIRASSAGEDRHILWTLAVVGVGGIREAEWEGPGKADGGLHKSIRPAASKAVSFIKTVGLCPAACLTGISRVSFWQPCNLWTGQEIKETTKARCVPVDSHQKQSDIFVTLKQLKVCGTPSCHGLGRHVSCTVEMADVSSTYEVAVVDECQLLADRYADAHLRQFWLENGKMKA